MVVVHSNQTKTDNAISWHTEILAVNLSFEKAMYFDNLKISKAIPFSK